MTFHFNKTYFIIFVLFFYHFIEIQSKSEDNFQYFGVKFKSVKCQSDNLTVYTKYCYLKAVSRKIVTFNLGVKLLVLLKKPFYGHGVVFYRYGTIFRQIIDVKKLEFCSILDGSDTNPFVKLMIVMLKIQAPHLIHKCPFNGDWDLRNFTVDSNLMDKVSMLFPEGTYRLDISAFINEKISFNFSGTADVKSPLKESFG